MAEFQDLTGKKYGRLIVVEYAGNGYWLCRCECGKARIIRKDALKNGKTKSCGCLQREVVTKHGFWNNVFPKGNRKFYRSWMGIKARCNNKKSKDYARYGGRGIKYDSKWADFLGFKEDMYFKYLYAIKQQKLKRPSIERKDVNGNYCFDNCTFIELEEQAGNRRATISFIATSPKGKKYKTKNVNEFSRNHNLNSSHVYECLDGKGNSHKGWTFKKIN